MAAAKLAHRGTIDRPSSTHGQPVKFVMTASWDLFSSPPRSPPRDRA
jgi:hypothetical protein